MILYRNNILKQKTNKDLEIFNKKKSIIKRVNRSKNKEIVDSINYAKRIQQSILTSDAYFKNILLIFFFI